MECLYCGSQDLLYDYIHGYVVCSSCGTINDYIFVEYFIPTSSDEIFGFKGLPTIREGFERKLAKNRLRELTKASRDVKIYESFAKRRRRDVYIDWDAVQKRLQGEKSRVYKHIAEDSIKRIMDADQLIKIIIEMIINVDPVLSSRTLRGKTALAIILKHIVVGNDIDIDRIAKETSLSKMHVRRLIALIKSRMKFIEKKIIELKSTILKPVSIT